MSTVNSANPFDADRGLADLYIHHWWGLLLRGLAAVAFGALAFALPGPTLAALVLLWGIYALVDGVLALWVAISGWSHLENRWLLVLEGVAGIWIGLVTFLTPGITAVALLVFIAAWSMTIGVLRIIAAVRLRRVIRGEFWLALSGIVSILFAFAIIVFPAAGALALVWLIGAYAIAFGIFLCVLSFRLRALRGGRQAYGTPRMA
jgi:uncharacterized membrane protein HdeD (DUF308 family)